MLRLLKSVRTVKLSVGTFVLAWYSCLFFRQRVLQVLLYCGVSLRNSEKRFKKNALVALNIRVSVVRTGQRTGQARSGVSLLFLD